MVQANVKTNRLMHDVLKRFDKIFISCRFAARF